MNPEHRRVRGQLLENSVGQIEHWSVDEIQLAVVVVPVAVVDRAANELP